MDGESDYVVVPIIIAGNLDIATTPIAVAIGEISMKVIIECQGNSCGAWLCSSVVKFQTRPLLITSEVTGVCQGKFAILQDAGIGQCVAYRGTDLILIRNIFGQQPSTVVTYGGPTWQSLINTCLTNIFCYATSSNVLIEGGAAGDGIAQCCAIQVCHRRGECCGTQCQHHNQCEQ